MDSLDVDKFMRELMERRRLKEEKRKEEQRLKDVEAAREAYYKYCRKMVNNVMKQATTKDDNPDEPWYLKNLMNRQKTKPEYNIEVHPLVFYYDLKTAWSKHHFMRNVDKRTVLPPPEDVPEYKKKTYILPRYPGQNYGMEDKSTIGTTKKPSLAVPCFSDFSKLSTKLDARKDKLNDVINRVLEDANLRPNSTFKMKPIERVQLGDNQSSTGVYMAAVMATRCKESDQILRDFSYKLQFCQDNMEDSVMTREPETSPSQETQRNAEDVDPATETKIMMEAGQTNMVEAMMESKSPALATVTEVELEACPTLQPTELTDVKIACLEKNSGIVITNETVRSYMYDKDVAGFCATHPPTENHAGLPEVHLVVPTLPEYDRSLASQFSEHDVVRVQEEIKPFKSSSSKRFLCRLKSRLSRVRRRLFPCFRSVATE